MRSFLGWTGAFLALASMASSMGLEPTDYSFLLSAQAVDSPAQLALSWAPNPSRQISIRRKSMADSAWGPVIATLPAGSTAFTDSNVEVGKVYEYQVAGILSDAPLHTAYGYIAAGIEIPKVEARGKVILIVDRTHADALADELETLRVDLIGDGWSVVRRDVWPTDSAPSVKALIQAEYIADPNNLRAVFLFGHVPVPYSGLISPDMHGNHLGAWPADVYYGEMDSAWTDSTVDKTGSQYPSNDNVPGDGKFDQSVIPSAVELCVGRVDMWRLDVFAPRTERDLLRNYLVKNHRFRHAQTTAPLRGLIRDNFDIIDGDVPGADAWRAFPALFGRANVREVGFGEFFSNLNWEGYLWAYGGGGGDFNKADGIGFSSDFAASDPKAIFYLLHGSYFGDWNTPNNFLRSAIATPNYGLVSIWTSLPHWYFQAVTLGETLGYATRLIQNNRGLYKSQADFSFGEVHISMMGDPTLRSFVLPPPQNVQLTAGAKVTLTWNAAAGSIDGYFFYRAASLNGPFVRLNNNPIRDTRFEETAPTANRVYMIKSAALQFTGSGSFHNLSQGVFIPYSAGTVDLPVVNITTISANGSEAGELIVFEFSRTGGTDEALNLSIQVSGSASEGDDFFAVSRTIEIPIGQTTARLSITPVADLVNEFDETLAISILPSGDYTLGTPSSANAKIIANGESKFTAPTISTTGTFTVTASGFANRPYRIESRQLDGAWGTRETATSDASGNVTFTETISMSETGEIFRIVWE